MTSQALIELCDKSIAAALQVVEEEAALDLAGLDEAVARLCHELVALPAAERGDALVTLARIDGQLDCLAAAIKRQEARRREAVARPVRGRAAEAYAPPSGGRG